MGTPTATKVEEKKRLGLCVCLCEIWLYQSVIFFHPVLDILRNISHAATNAKAK